MSEKKRKIVEGLKRWKWIIVAVIIIIIVIALILFLKVKRDNSLNIHDLFGEKFDIREIPQISEVYGLSSLIEYRSYNPCLFLMNNDDQPYMVYRMCNFAQCPGKKNKWNEKFRERTRSHTLIESPSGELFIVKNPKTSGPKCEQGCQDARTFVKGNNLHLVCNDTSGPDCRREMFMMEVDLSEFNISEHRTLTTEKHRTYVREIIPKSMTRLNCGFDNHRDQKNWMPLIINDQILFVYSINPHIIVHYTGLTNYKNVIDGDLMKPLNPINDHDNVNCIKIAESSNPKLPNNLRGGGQIIQVKKWNPILEPTVNDNYRRYKAEDLYLGIIHTRESDQEYSTYFYAFDVKYPYRVKYITKPFVFGDKSSHSRRIQFASGLIRIVDKDERANKLYVTYGENDCTGKLCVFLEEDVLRALNSVD